MTSDRSDAGIRLLGYAAARRRNLLAEDAARPRRVGPRPDGLLPRTLPAVINSRRVLPAQLGTYLPGMDYPVPAYWPYDEDDRDLTSNPAEHRPLIDELTTEQLAREAVASLRQHHSPATRPPLAPELLELGAEHLPQRADRRVPSGRHRGPGMGPNQPLNPVRSLRTRVVWAVAAAGVLALGTGFTAWAMSTPPDANQQQPPAPSQLVTPSPTPAPIQPPVISTNRPATSTAGVPTEIVPSPTAQPQPVVPAGPAVVITLDPDDPGFGWPSSAFGTSNP